MVTSPELGWQKVYQKGKNPRTLYTSNQGGKGAGGKITLQGKGSNPGAELQLAQSISRAAAAIRRAEGAIEEYGNGSGPAEEAYTEAAAAINGLMEADAALHPPTGASSSSSASPRIGRGAASMGLETYRAFLKGKGKGGSEGPDRDGSEDRDAESGQEEDPDQEDALYEEYNEEIEEEHAAKGGVHGIFQMLTF